MPVADINAKLQSLATASNGADLNRNAVYFMPGTYGSAAGANDPATATGYIDSSVGFMESVQGLGTSPGDVRINGNLHSGGPGQRALGYFWRSLANMRINPIQADMPAHTMRWSTSQASPLRRLDVAGNLEVGGAESFGTMMANSRVSGVMKLTMSTTTPPTATTRDAAAPITAGAWRLDPTRSSVAFHVRHFYGLVTVKGEIAEYEGTLDLSATPAVELTIEAATLDTKLAKRDEHLRSEDFFDVARHPQVRFVADDARLDGDALRVRGQLHAAGRQIPLELHASLREVDGELEIDAVTEADQRELGMTWSPLGILRAPSELIVRGRLVRR